MITFNYRKQKHVVFIDSDGAPNVSPVWELNDRPTADAATAIKYANWLLDIATAGMAGKDTRDLARAIIAAAQK